MKSDASGETTGATPEFKKRNRVHTKDIILFVGTALFFDGLQILFSLILSFGGWALAAIPVIGKVYAVAASVFGVALSAIISLFAWLTFYTWTSIKKWGVSGKLKQLIVRWLIPIIELIPYLNVLPTWTIRAILQLLTVRAEDAIYNKSRGRIDLEKRKRKTMVSSTPDFKKAA